MYHTRHSIMNIFIYPKEWLQSLFELVCVFLFSLISMRRMFHNLGAMCEKALSPCFVPILVSGFFGVTFLQNLPGVIMILAFLDHCPARSYERLKVSWRLSCDWLSTKKYLPLTNLKSSFLTLTWQNNFEHVVILWLDCC